MLCVLRSDTAVGDMMEMWGEYLVYQGFADTGDDLCLNAVLAEVLTINKKNLRANVLYLYLMLVTY